MNSARFACVLGVWQYALVKSYGVSNRTDSRHRKFKNLRLTVSVFLNTLELSTLPVKKLRLHLHGDKLTHAFFFFLTHFHILVFPSDAESMDLSPLRFYCFLSTSTVLIFWILFFWECKIFTSGCLALWYYHMLMLSGLYFVERVDSSTLIFFGRNDRPFFLDTVFKDYQFSTGSIFVFKSSTSISLMSRVYCHLSTHLTFGFWMDQLTHLCYFPESISSLRVEPCWPNKLVMSHWQHTNPVHMGSAKGHINSQNQSFHQQTLEACNVNVCDAAARPITYFSSKTFELFGMQCVHRNSVV